MSNLFLKPAAITLDGARRPALVRDPATLIPLAESGEWKRCSQFWLRRLRDGDVVEADPAAVLAAAPEADAPAPASDPPAAFAACEPCATPQACVDAARCVQAPLA